MTLLFFKQNMLRFQIFYLAALQLTEFLLIYLRIRKICLNIKEQTKNDCIAALVGLKMPTTIKFVNKDISP